MLVASVVGNRIPFNDRSVDADAILGAISDYTSDGEP